MMFFILELKIEVKSPPFCLKCAPFLPNSKLPVVFLLRKFCSEAREKQESNVFKPPFRFSYTFS